MRVHRFIAICVNDAQEIDEAHLVFLGVRIEAVLSCKLPPYRRLLNDLAEIAGENAHKGISHDGKARHATQLRRTK